MTSIVLCLLAFLVTLLVGRRSLGWGVVSILTIGYFFGIVRANLLSTFIFFFFDAAVFGLYCSQKRLFTGGAKRTKMLRVWIIALMAWPVLLLFMPFQPFLISLVGLRGSMMFLPMALIGSRLADSDLRKIWVGFALLNIIALGFAGGEYFLGLPRFYPYNAATILIYGSQDVAGGFYRIPGIFANAHLYGGTVAASIPYLLGGWERAESRFMRLLAMGGIASALLGVLLSATRINFVLAAGLVLATLLNGRISKRRVLMFVGIIAGMLVFALQNQRLQRFKSLSDTDYVESRISGSVNRGFFEILLEYPMGNGLGGGGTSIPYFLQGEVRNPIGMESEYARLLCEQGFIGLTIWIGFLGWFLSRFQKIVSKRSSKGTWDGTRKLTWFLSIFELGMGFVGMGTFTAIPSTAMLLMGMGWTAVPMSPETGGRAGARARLRMPAPVLGQPRPVVPV